MPIQSKTHLLQDLLFFSERSLEPISLLKMLRNITGDFYQEGNSGGIVQTPESWDHAQQTPVEDGFFCIKIFGQWQKQKQTQKWGHFYTLPVYHPATAPLIAEILKIPRHTVDAIGNYKIEWKNGELAPRDFDADYRESGPALLRKLLAQTQVHPKLRAEGFDNEDLVLTTIPVPPPYIRPLIKGDGGAAIPGYENSLFEELLYLNQYRHEFKPNWYTPDESSSFESKIQYNLQMNFFKLLQVMESRRTNSAWVWPQNNTQDELGDISQMLDLPPNDRTIPYPYGAPQYNMHHDNETVNPTLPINCCFAGENRIIVQYPQHILLIDSQQKRLVYTKEVRSADLLGTNKAQTKALFFTGYKFHILDIQSGQWLEGFDPDFQYFYLFGDSVKPTIKDFITDQEIELSSRLHYPERFVISSNMEYVWLEGCRQMGGIYKLNTGICQLDTYDWGYGKRNPIVINPKGRVLSLKDELTDEHDYDPFNEILEELCEHSKASEEFLKKKGAFTLKQEKWIGYYYGDIVHGDNIEAFVQFPAATANFDYNGAKLLLVNKQQFAIIDINKLLKGELNTMQTFDLRIFELFAFALQ